MGTLVQLLEKRFQIGASSGWPGDIALFGLELSVGAVGEKKCDPDRLYGSGRGAARQPRFSGRHDRRDTEETGRFVRGRTGAVDEQEPGHCRRESAEEYGGRAPGHRLARRSCATTPRLGLGDRKVPRAQTASALPLSRRSPRARDGHYSDSLLGVEVGTVAARCVRPRRLAKKLATALATASATFS